MNVLVLENPKKQTGVLQGKEICEFIESQCGHLALLDENAWEAHLELKSGDYGYVIIHHHSNNEIDFLKERYPEVMYAAYGSKHSSMIFNFNNNSYKDRMLKRYDEFLYGPACIQKMVLTR